MESIRINTDDSSEDFCSSVLPSSPYVITCPSYSSNVNKEEDNSETNINSFSSLQYTLPSSSSIPSLSTTSTFETTTTSILPSSFIPKTLLTTTKTTTTTKPTITDNPVLAPSPPSHVNPARKLHNFEHHVHFVPEVKNEDIVRKKNLKAVEGHQLLKIYQAVISVDENEIDLKNKEKSSAEHGNNSDNQDLATTTKSKKRPSSTDCDNDRNFDRVYHNNTHHHNKIKYKGETGTEDNDIMITEKRKNETMTIKGRNVSKIIKKKNDRISSQQKRASGISLNSHLAHKGSYSNNKESDKNNRDSYDSNGSVYNNDKNSQTREKVQPNSKWNINNKSNNDKRKKKNDKTAQKNHSEIEKRKKYLKLNILKLAQDGDLKLFQENLTELSKLCGDLDFPSLVRSIKDRFGWTVLMIASVGANVDIVNYLLFTLHVDHTVVNENRQTANQLALCSNNFEICQLIQKYESIKLKKSVAEKGTQVKDFSSNGSFESPGKPKQLRTAPDLMVTCEVCNEEMSVAAFNSSHKYSTTHLFNVNQVHPSTESRNYPVSSLGYKLLKQAGWNEMGGLGKDQQGQLYPVRTLLKNDYYGVGITRGNDGKKIVPKITHDSNVEGKVKKKSRQPALKVRDLRRIEEKERQREKVIRGYFK